MIGNCTESRIIRRTIYRGAIAGNRMNLLKAAPLQIEIPSQDRGASVPEGACSGKNIFSKKLCDKDHSEKKSAGFHF